MFHASRALTAANAARYFEAEYRQGDYYTRGDSTAPGRWFGRAAADLGLQGGIQPADFTALLEGRAPDGTPLVQAQQSTGRRRAGWDFTCSADKSVSIAALVFEDGRLIEAHDAAVRLALTNSKRSSRRAPRRARKCRPPGAWPPHCSATSRAGRSTRNTTHTS